MDSGQRSSESFPTLSERLADARRAAREHAASRRMAVWIEGGTPSLEAATVAAAAAASMIAVVRPGDARTATGDAATVESWPSRPLRNLADLRALLDEAGDADLVVIEEGREPDSAALAELATAAYADSVCTTVSSGAPGDGRPAADAEAIPPPAIDAPEWGLVYVRRDGLDFAVDTAKALGAGAALSSEPIRDVLTRLLSPPGLVHRRLELAAAEPSGSPHAPAAAVRSTINVTMDVRHLEAPVTGTQVQSLALLAALARTGKVRLSALTPAEVHPSAMPLIEPLRDEVDFSRRVPIDRTDVFYRPNQIGSVDELAECLAFGRRFVLTHQDMIGDRTTAYFPSPAVVASVRGATNAALGTADHVGFFSEHAALDALSDRVLEPDRATVVPLGVDHVRDEGPSGTPAELRALGERPFLLVLGTSFGHKNRLFALRVVDELVNRGWDGGIVIAGRGVPYGSSVRSEQRFLQARPTLRERVVVVDHVTEEVKRGLYRRAALVLFPSLYEGFGLVPFEAAVFGKPCLYAWRGPMREFLPRAGALPTNLDVPETASRVVELIDSPSAAQAVVSDIRAAAVPLTWDETARGYLQVFERALDAPPRPVERSIARRFGGSVANDGIPLSDMEAGVLRVYRRHSSFRGVVDLVVRGGGRAARAARRARALRARGTSD